MAVPRQKLPPDGHNDGDETDDNGSTPQGTVVLEEESDSQSPIDITVDDSTDGETLAVLDEVDMEVDRVDTGEVGIADDNLLGKFQIDAYFILVF